MGDNGRRQNCAWLPNLRPSSAYRPGNIPRPRIASSNLGATITYALTSYRRACVPYVAREDNRLAQWLLALALPSCNPAPQPYSPVNGLTSPGALRLLRFGPAPAQSGTGRGDGTAELAQLKAGRSRWLAASVVRMRCTETCRDKLQAKTTEDRTREHPESGIPPLRLMKPPHVQYSAPPTSTRWLALPTSLLGAARLWRFPGGSGQRVQIKDLEHIGSDLQ